jgi:hypothetical protein
LPGRNKKAIFPCAVGRIVFLIQALQGRTAFGQTPPAETNYKEENMDVKAPQRLDPQEILKLLVALRRALKAQVA